MKIISYNIANCTQAKITQLLATDADLYIVPECANNNIIHIPNGYGFLWTGDEDCPSKGLGVIWKQPFAFQLVSHFTKVPHHIPLLFNINGTTIFVLACWPTVRNTNKSYPQLLLEVLNEYNEYFSQYPSMAIGDFNCFVGQSGTKKSAGCFEDCIQFFEAHNMKSLYHKQKNETFSQESEATFYWRFNEQSPFFLDYAFTNIATATLKLGDWQRVFSDHRAQIITL